MKTLSKKPPIKGLYVCKNCDFMFVNDKKKTNLCENCWACTFCLRTFGIETPQNKSLISDSLLCAPCAEDIPF